MNICVFDAKELKRCITHALQSTKWFMGHAGDDETPGPGLFLVHDDGVYLMSNGDPADQLSSGELGCHVVYAKGCNPKKDEDWWDTARALVGGDDFADLIKINETYLKSCDENDEFHAHVTPDAILTRFAEKEKEPV